MREGRPFTSLLISREADLVTQSVLLEESFIVSGTHAKIILADYKIPEVGYEPIVVFDEENPVETYLLVQDPPQPKLLKQLGWDFESDNDYTKPMLVSVPRYLSMPREDGLKPTEFFELKINRFTKIYLDWDKDSKDKIFQVTNVSTNMFNPVFYYLKIVPFREHVTVDPSPVNDPNLTQLDKPGQFKHLTFTPREDTTKQIY